MNFDITLSLYTIGLNPCMSLALAEGQTTSLMYLKKKYLSDTTTLLLQIFSLFIPRDFLDNCLLDI